MLSDEQIVAVAKKYARRINIQDRDDLEQEIVINLLRARNKFDPEKGTWDAYSATTAFGTIREFWKNHPTWDRLNSRMVHNIPYEEMLHEVPKEDVYEHLELIECLSLLQLRERKILLFLISGYTRAEISHMLNISRSRISIILQNFQLANLEFSTMHPRDLQVRKLAA